MVHKEKRFTRYLDFDELFGFKDDAVTNISSLNWYRLWENYVDIFGKENVLALPYEMLLEDPKGFVKLVGEFAECTFDVHESVFEIRENADTKSPVFLETKLRLSRNHLTRKVMASPSIANIATKFSLSKPARKFFEVRMPFMNIRHEELAIILDTHVQDNSKLACDIGVPLQTYGYY